MLARYTCLTSAMATPPFSVKVLSFRLMTRSRGLMANAWARAVTPGWLIPFCGIWTSSRVPMICGAKELRGLAWCSTDAQWEMLPVSRAQSSRQAFEYGYIRSKEKARSQRWQRLARLTTRMEVSRRYPWCGGGGALFWMCRTTHLSEDLLSSYGLTFRPCPFRPLTPHPLLWSTTVSPFADISIYLTDSKLEP